MRKTVLILCLTGIIIALGTFTTLKYLAPVQTETTNTTDRLSSIRESVTAPPQSTAPAAKKSEVDIINNTLSGIVGVSSETVTAETAFKEKRTVLSTGSGVVVTEDGYILTNQHVLGAVPKNVNVTLATGEILSATVEWHDATLDLAVLKIDKTALNAVTLGNVKHCRVGQTVYAIGNPLGLQFQRTVTKGVLSAMYRTIDTTLGDGSSIFMEDLLQTDASINPGNSGGALINENGELIGINTIKIPSAEGMGFAIPVNVAKPIVESFAKNGSFDQPHFGIFAYDRPIADYLSQNFEQKTGIYVVKVDNNSPASMIGLKSNDVITHINRTEVNTMMEFREQIYSSSIDSYVSVTFISEGIMREATVRLRRK